MSLEAEVLIIPDKTMPCWQNYFSKGGCRGFRGRLCNCVVSQVVLNPEIGERVSTGAHICLLNNKSLTEFNFGNLRIKD